MQNLRSINDLDDPRIAAYRNLKDRELARDGERFIAEGSHVVERLIRSTYSVESVMLAARRVDTFARLVPQSVPVYILPEALVHQVIGYKFHSGVAACGKRRPPQTLEQAMTRLGRRAMIMVCPEIANTENLGVLMRISAGLGADAMVLGPQSCDPFYRQAIRVSMGTVFSLNLYQSQDLLKDLARMQTEWGVERIATVLDESAEPLDRAKRSDRIALL
jgi:tRNA G18 (ribose-2'-O)-methylase SpoU